MFGCARDHGKKAVLSSERPNRGTCASFDFFKVDHPKTPKICLSVKRSSVFLKVGISAKVLSDSNWCGVRI